MNDEEIERYEEQRRKHFWEFLKKITLPLVLIISVLLITSCQPTGGPRDADNNGIPDPFNLTKMGNATGYVELIQIVDSELMDNLFGVLILLAVFAISTMAFISTTGHTMKAISASSFMVFVLSLLLKTMNLVPDYAVYGSAIILAISTVALIPRE